VIFIWCKGKVSFAHKKSYSNLITTIVLTWHNPRSSMKYILSEYKMQCKVFLSSWWCLLWANFHNKLYWFLSCTGTLPHWLTIFLYSLGRRPISEDLQCVRFEWREHRGYHMATQIWNFSSSVEKYFTSEHSKRVKYPSTPEEQFPISERPCNVLFIISTPMK